MNIKTKQIAPLGFNGSGMYDYATSYNHYYKKDPVNYRIIGVTSLCGNTVFSFQLTKEQYAAFEKGNLSLVPPGCCCASGRPYIDNDECNIHYDGNIKNVKHLEEILATIDVFYS
jgi:hypothetical protein